MAVRCDEYNKVCVMTIEGDLTAENADAMRKAAEERIETKHIADFIVDLEHSGFMESEGLESLLWLKRQSEGLFGQTKLAGLDDNCRKILELTRLEHRFEAHPDLAAALKMMR